MRKTRDSLGWTLDRLAAATGISRPTLSRIETGARRPEVDEVASVLTALSVTGPAKDRLIRLAADARGTWVGIGEGMYQHLTALISYESEARSIHEFQLSLVPGLLQTPAYARAILNAGPAGLVDREQALLPRISRQSALSRPSLECYCVFLDEAVLRRPVGTDPRTMPEQLKALLDIGARPGKIIRVIPFSAGPYWGYEGPFGRYELNHGHTVVYQENAASTLLIDNEDDDIYKKILDHMDGIALSSGESAKLITHYAERYEAS